MLGGKLFDMGEGWAGKVVQNVQLESKFLLLSWVTFRSVLGLNIFIHKMGIIMPTS